MADNDPAKLTVKSNTFKHGETMPQPTLFDGMGVGGGNRSPHIAWHGAPESTKSYAIVLHDPDAPTGTGFFHWILFNIPASVTELPEGTGATDGARVPVGASHGHTDFGGTGYGGPAPPPGHGPHRYNFHVYALDVPKIDAGETSTAALVRFMMLGHIVGEGVLTGIYER